MAIALRAVWGIFRWRGAGKVAMVCPTRRAGLVGVCCCRIGYLAFAPEACRTVLADHPANAALANLRLVLLNLRQALGAGGLPMLLIDRESVRFARRPCSPSIPPASPPCSRKGGTSNRDNRLRFPICGIWPLPLPCIVANSWLASLSPNARTLKPGCRCAVRHGIATPWRFWPAYRMPMTPGWTMSCPSVCRAPLGTCAMERGKPTGA